MPRFSAMPVTTGRDDPDLLDVPTWDAVKATASETFSSSPTPASYRADALDVARDNSYRGYSPNGGTPYRFGAPLKNTQTPITKEQAEAKIDAAGLTGQLKYTPGDTEESLSMLMSYKTEEMRNKFTLDRYRGGVTGGAVTLGAALATSLVDPINVGSAFVPVVGEARYASLLGNAGKSMFARAGVRAGVGAIEGTVGAAIVEPLIYRSKKDIQADYDAMDSLVNIGFGGLFGGVLQPAAGGIGDVFARRAGIGAWAEPTTGTLDSAAPVVPEGWLAGGGTQFVDGEDYVRGSWAVVDANTLTTPEAARFDATDPGQVGAAPWADSGAPVVSPDGTVINGNRRMASLLGDYADGNGLEYRNQLIENAEKYGLDSEAVSGVDNPVLVRLEGERQAGVWGEYQRMLADSPAVRAARQPFESPDILASRQFIDRATGRGVSDEVAQELAPVAARDDVTGFYDGRQSGMKSGTVQRALEHATKTGEPASFVSADIANLGGLNAAVGNRADEANIHFRAMSDIMDNELRQTGGDVVSMRTGGDELGSVVVNASLADVDKALTRAENKIRHYAQENGLDTIPHPKGGKDGVGMHFGMAEIRPGSKVADIFNAADAGVDVSKRGGVSGRQEIVDQALDVPVREGTGITEQQNRTAISTGVLQAVNGDRINPAPTFQMDGTQAGVERFLEMKRLADAAEIAVRDTQVASMESLRKSLEQFTPEQTSKLDADVAKLEADLRERVRAGGGDEADIDRALAEVADAAAEADVESKALKGVSLCMLRNV